MNKSQDYIMNMVQLIMVDIKILDSYTDDDKTENATMYGNDLEMLITDVRRLKDILETEMGNV